MPLLLDQRSTDTLRDTLRDARAGAPAALAELFARYAGLVQRVAYRLLADRDEAEDVVQDVFVGLPEALRTFDGRGSVEGWVHRVATRTALMRLRRRRTEQRVEQRAEGRQNTPAVPHGDAVVARLTLSDALARLPVDLRTVFVLHKMEGYPHAEIAALLGIQVGTSEVRLHRAIRQLRLLLEPS